MKITLTEALIYKRLLAKRLLRTIQLLRSIQSACAAAYEESEKLAQLLDVKDREEGRLRRALYASHLSIARLGNDLLLARRDRDEWRTRAETTYVAPTGAMLDAISEIPTRSEEDIRAWEEGERFGPETDYQLRSSGL